MTLIIRPLKDSEIDYLKEMLYEAIFTAENEPPPPRSIIHAPKLKEYYENWGMEGDIALVAEKDGQRIGIVWNRIFKEYNKGYGFVDEDTPEVSISVHPDYRNQGIGTQLLRSIFHITASMGIKKMKKPPERLVESTGRDKVKFEVYGEEMVEKTVKLSGNSGRVYLPPDWVGSRVKIIRVD